MRRFRWARHTGLRAPGDQGAVVEVRRTWERVPSTVFKHLLGTSCGLPDVWSSVPGDWLFVARGLYAEQSTRQRD